MNRFFTFLTLFVVLCVADARAQFTVEDSSKKSNAGKVNVQSQLQNIEVSSQYQSDARDRLERMRIRKERNYVEITLSLQGTMTSYNDGWSDVKGGDNTITALGTFGLKHTYTKDRFSNNTQVSAKYGYNRLRVDVTDEQTQETHRDGVWFKNIDEFWLQVQPKLALNSKWSYTAMAKFRSQFSNSYTSRTQQTDNDVISGFLAPGNFDFSLGMDFASPSKKFPIKISFFPLSGNAVLAHNKLVERNYRNKNATSWFGVDIDKNTLFTGGSSVKFEFARSWGKNNWLSYSGNLYCYYGWISNVSNLSKIRDYEDYEDALAKWEAEGRPEGLEPKSVPFHRMLHPTVDWRNTFTIKASSYFQTQVTIDMLYDKAQHSDVMLKSYISLGLTYTFKNK